jgi:hypothetical protein
MSSPTRSGSLWCDRPLAHAGTDSPGHSVEHWRKLGSKDPGPRIAWNRLMARKRSRIDGFKLPFVLTVTMATGACGGTVTTRDGDGNRVGDGSGGQGANAGGAGDHMSVGGRKPDPRVAAGGSVNPPAPYCPSVVPPSGTPCSGSLSCSYPGPTACDLGHSAQCVDAQWSVTTMTSGGCNPPFPITTCPLTEPPDGSYCSYQGSPCSYDNGQCPFPDTQAICTGNQWTVKHTYCDPSWPSDGGVDSGVGVVVDAGEARD